MTTTAELTPLLKRLKLGAMLDTLAGEGSACAQGAARLSSPSCR